MNRRRLHATGLTCEDWYAKVAWTGATADPAGEISRTAAKATRPMDGARPTG